MSFNKYNLLLLVYLEIDLLKNYYFILDTKRKIFLNLSSNQNKENQIFKQAFE